MPTDVFVDSNEVAPQRVSPGRPRNADATAAVLKAALELAYEGDLGNATVERIAQRSGVSKAAIYRRWPNAWAVVMESFFVEIAPSISYAEERTVDATFKVVAKKLITELKGRRGHLLSMLLAAAQLDAVLMQEFMAKWIHPRRLLAREVIERAKQRGEVREDVNADVLIDTIFGAVYYRLTIPYAQLDDAYVSRLIDTAFTGASTTEARKNASR
ncbi:TetR family transcriptional regulator [Burkholderia sp. SRS-46]|nr:TetR family transcriptional regulator [Burkholderia sp. SRS-46]